MNDWIGWEQKDSIRRHYLRKFELSKLTKDRF